MTQTSDIENNLNLFRDDMYAHYQNIYQEFKIDIQGTAPDIDIVSGNAAYLSLMQAFITQIDNTLPQVEKNAAVWESLFKEESTEDIVQGFLVKISDILENTAQNSDFRAQALYVSQNETPYVDEEAFFNAFDSVIEWIKNAISNAPAIIKEHKSGIDNKPRPTPPGTPPPSLH